ncbi:PAS domain-containing protein [Spirosoma sp. BT702]|uniref:histidine kinase n=1 Tax=Spirosoma profusum TaxID=2771354 RepID=A0A926XYC5_9BACT|nr:ATP-binding protein [Spirosoma profusum]MBD2702475.1 PAS domain-containing protein [Spirosoma profusum]
MRKSSTNSSGLAFHLPLINAMPGKHLILLPDPSFTIAAVSDDYLAALGIQRDFLVGNGLFKAYFKQKNNQGISEQLLQSLTQVVQTKQIHFMTDQHHQWPNIQTGVLEWRSWRPVNKPVIDSDGEIVFIIHTVEDVTNERQLVEVAEANQYLQTIINLFKEPLQVLKPIFENGEIIDFRFQLTNQAYAFYANTTPQGLQGKRVGEVFPGYFETASFTKPVETYKTGQPLTFEIHYDKDGLDLYNLMSTFKLDEEVVIHFTDFTNLRQLQFQLENKIDELNRSNDNLQQFAYIASHDLQEPLRKIQSFSTLLATDLEGKLSPSNIDYLQRISSASTRMSRLIKDLLDYSRLSANQQSFSPVSLASVVTDVLTMLDWSVSQANAQVDVGPLPIVNGDAGQLGQLFQNLLSNALKFSRPNQPPKVEVSSEQVAKSALPVGFKPKSTSTMFHQISICDEGIGFDEQHVERIFQIFQRLHGKHQYSGTGIGLAICQQVVNNHGGYITATSKLGEGSVFWVYLPVTSSQ